MTGGLIFIWTITSSGLDLHEAQSHLYLKYLILKVTFQDWPHTELDFLNSNLSAKFLPSIGPVCEPVIAQDFAKYGHNCRDFKITPLTKDFR